MQDPSLLALADRPDARVYLRPYALLSGPDAAMLMAGGEALPLAGGRVAFSRAELIVRASGETARVSLSAGALRSLAAEPGGGAGPALVADRLDRITSARQPFAGVSLDRPSIMAVVNVTPDSFSDGGDFADGAAALAHIAACHDAGADVIDIGAESTRPFAATVTENEELRRLEPVFAGLRGMGPRVVSIDTRRAAVMAAGLDAGAAVVNDVSSLSDDPAALALVADREAFVVLMHRRGDASTMQLDPIYEEVSLDVFDYLEQRVRACESAGLPRGRIMADPGIGFGKTLEHNLDLLRSLTLFHGLGCGLLVGGSRKSWIGRLTGGAAPKDRMAGSLVGAIRAWDQGVQMVRVHDVAETAQARSVWAALHPPIGA